MNMNTETRPPRDALRWTWWHWLQHTSGRRGLDHWDDGRWRTLGSPAQAAAAGWSYGESARMDDTWRNPERVLRRPSRQVGAKS
jgi:hypothetical protein